MNSQSLKAYLEPRSNLVGFGVGCAIVAVVALYTIFLLQVQTSDGHLSPGENQDLEVADVLGDLETFLSTKSSGPTSEVLRKTRLYEFLEHTSENRLAALLRQSEDIEDSTWRNTIQSSTLRRLTAINPLKALNLSSSYPREQRRWLVETVFNEWSLMDLSGAATAGIKRQGVDRDIALRAILQTRTDLPEERRIAIGRQFDREELALRLIQENSYLSQSENPEDAWISTMENGRDLLPIFDSLVDIARAWVELDGVRALTPILESLKNKLGADVIAKEIISLVSQDDPSGTFEQVLMSPDHRNSLIRLTGNWATVDGVSALRSVATVEDYATRRDLTSVVMGRWADSDPKGLLEHRNEFPPDMILTVLNLAISKIARQDSDEAIELIETLRGEGVNTWTVEDTFVKATASMDPRSTLDWILTEASSRNPYRMEMLRKSIVELARREPALAMEAALKQSVDGENPIEESVIEIVSRSDIDLATELLDQVRDEGKDSSFFHVGRALIERGAPLKALELGPQLNEDQQDLYYTRIFQTWAHANPQQLVNSLQDLSSDRIRTLAALSLLRTNADRPVLNSDQLEYVESQLSQDHLDELSY